MSTTTSKYGVKVVEALKSPASIMIRSSGSFTSFTVAGLRA
jgi:hypothetical protein